MRKAKGRYIALVYVDGLDRTERKRFATGLRDLRIRTRKVRGAREESEALIRLADAVCGFLRDYIEKQPYTEQLYKSLRESKIITELE